MTIYLLRNKLNGKSYVGQTTRTAQRRWLEHQFDVVRGCNYLLHKAIRKHGAENFELVELASAFDQDGLNFLESHFIGAFKTLTPLGYNLTSGGSRGVPSEETRTRLSLAKIGRPNNFAGHRHSEETRRKFSQIMRARTPRRGFHLSEETKAKLSAVLRGRKNSAEHNAKISATKKAKAQQKVQPAVEVREPNKRIYVKTGPPSLETRMKISLAKKGVKRTPEQRQRISLGIRQKRAERKALSIAPLS